MKQASHSQRPKTRYKVNNWPAYNEALKNRGSITMWFSEDSEQQWYYQGEQQRGAQYVYSDEAIKIAISIRQVFHLPFRQTEGFLCSLIKLIGVQINAPNYTVLCRRMKTLAVQIKPQKRITDIVFDGSGLKVFGDGEWKVRQHGVGKRRTWRKIHVGLDPKGKQVQVMEITTNAVHDSDAALHMLEYYDFPNLKKFYGDGGYDKWKVYNILDDLKIKPIIAPRKDARIKKHGNVRGKPIPRDKILRLIRKHGRKKWKKTSHYHRRSLVENFFYRYKTIFGERLKSKSWVNQQVEAIINVSVLNKMIRTGAPKSIKIKTAA